MDKTAEMLNKYYKKERKKKIEDNALFFVEATDNRDVIAMYQQIKEADLGLELIWVVADNTGLQCNESEVKMIVEGTKEFYYYLARARYLFASEKITSDYRKRKEQRYFQFRSMTHTKQGLLADLSVDIEENREKIVGILEDARRWSYLVTGSNAVEELILEETGYNRKKLCVGRPAYDYMFDKNIDKRAIKEQLGTNKQIILWDSQSSIPKNLVAKEYTIIDINNLHEYSEISLNLIKLVTDIYVCDHYQNIEEIANLNIINIYLNENNEEEYEIFPGIYVSSNTDILSVIEQNQKDSQLIEEKLIEFNSMFNEYTKGNAANLIIQKAKIGAKNVSYIVKMKKKLRKKFNKLKIKVVWKKIYPLFQKLPVQDNLIVFESFLGRNYSDNPKAIYEYMEKNYPEFEYVIFLNDPKSAKGEIPGKAKIVKKVSFEYIYYASRAKYIISNSRMSLRLNIRPEQTYIQTWHGTPLKKLVMDMQNVTLPGTNKQKYLLNFLKEAKRWNYLISANEHSTKVFNSAFLQENILETGYPRNDILVNKTNEDILMYREKLGLTSEDKVLLYAPTFRDDEYVSRGNYTQKIELDLAKIEAELPEWKILLRTHYLVTENMDLSHDNVINVSDYHDINHLYLAADVLMTDYSSVFFDYAILDRPMIFFAYDLEKYESDLRGFYLDYEKEIPGKNIDGTEELIEILSDIDKYEEQYWAKRQDFRKKFTSLETGTASKQIAELIVNNK